MVDYYFNSASNWTYDVTTSANTAASNLWYTTTAATNVVSTNVFFDSGTAGTYTPLWYIPTWLTQPRELTAAERDAAAAERERYEAELRRQSEEWRRLHQEHERRAAAARDRASALLLASLDDEQRAAFEARSRFRVVGADGKLYEIGRGRQHNVWELDERGRRHTEFCITHPDLPDDDVVLAQKLLLETDPARFRRIANATRVAA